MHDIEQVACFLSTCLYQFDWKLDCLVFCSMEIRPANKSKRGDILPSDPPILKSEVNENVTKKKDNNHFCEEFIIRIFYSKT